MKKKIILTLASLFSLTLISSAVYAAPKDAACEGLQHAGGTQVVCGDEKTAKEGINNLLSSVINILSVVVGAVAVIMLIIGGVRYVVSGGDTTGVQGAKNTILYALVGLVIVLFAQVMVRFVISKTTPEPVTRLTPKTVIV